MAFLLAYNFQRPLRILNFKSPDDMILEIYDQKSTLFLVNPVQKIINKWTIGIRAFYARTTERMIAFGPNFGIPFTPSMGEDLFEIRVRGKEGLGRAFFYIAVGRKVVILHASSKKR